MKQIPELYSKIARDAWFRNYVAKLKKKGSVPKVGIFWIDVKESKLFGPEPLSLRDADTLGETKQDLRDHYTEWDNLGSKKPDRFKFCEYEEVPRGRVVFILDKENSHFVVFLPKKVKSEKIEFLIADYFSLPSGKTFFNYTDMHYQIKKLL